MDDDRTWCLVQSEFRLLAMRDRTVAPQLLARQQGFRESLTPIVLGAFGKAGRVVGGGGRPPRPRTAGGHRPDAVEASILAGEDVRDLVQVRTDLARTALVLTRPSTG